MKTRENNMSEMACYKVYIRLINIITNQNSAYHIYQTFRSEFNRLEFRVFLFLE